MYKVYEKCRDIVLWCFKPGRRSLKEKLARKCPRPTANNGDSDDEVTKPSKKKGEKIAKNIAEVGEILKKLQDEHRSLYSIEKLNAWAHMIDIGKHDSYETPPDLPYFRGKAKRKREVTPEGSAGPNLGGTCGSSVASSLVTCVSPGKRITMHTQLLVQMEQWHSLLDKGGITKEQYDDLQSTILKDIYGNTFN